MTGEPKRSEASPEEEGSCPHASSNHQEAQRSNKVFRSERNRTYPPAVRRDRDKQRRSEVKGHEGASDGRKRTRWPLELEDGRGENPNCLGEKSNGRERKQKKTVHYKKTCL